MIQLIQVLTLNQLNSEVVSTIEMNFRLRSAANQLVKSSLGSGGFSWRLVEGPRGLVGFLVLSNLKEY